MQECCGKFEGPIVSYPKYFLIDKIGQKNPLLDTLPFSHLQDYFFYNLLVIPLES